MNSPAPAIPVARGLSTWPAKPPGFDAIDPPVPRRRVQPGLPGDTMLFDGRRVASSECPDDSQTSPATLPGANQAPVAGKLHDLPSGDLLTWIERLNRANIWARRNSSPDLIQQINTALRRPIDTIICGVLDVDPAACLQSAFAAAHTAELLAGVTLLARLCTAPRRWIALDRRTPSGWWNPLRQAARGVDVKLIDLTNDYPLGDPTLLLYTLTGRRLRPGRLPAEMGVLVIDAVTAVTVGACALHGSAMTRLPLVIRDHDRQESYFITAPLGVRVGDILSALSLPGSTAGMILRGGEVLRDQQIGPDAVLSGSELLLHLSSPTPAINPDPCIRCGWCFEACPTRIQPATLLEAAQQNDPDLADRAGLAACIECGICTYVCPSKLPILAGIRALRTM